jgi:hypothetical protein
MRIIVWLYVKWSFTFSLLSYLFFFFSFLHHSFRDVSSIFPVILSLSPARSCKLLSIILCLFFLQLGCLLSLARDWEYFYLLTTISWVLISIIEVFLFGEHHVMSFNFFKVFLGDVWSLVYIFNFCYQRF